MLSNRESARRSRRRKQAHLGHLQLKVNQLQCENQDLLHKLHQLHGSFNTMMERNRMIKDNMAFLRMQIMSGKPLSREALAAVTQAVAVGEQTNLQAHLNSTLFGPNGATTPMMMQPNGQSMGVPYTSASMGAMGGMMQGGMQGGMVPGPHGGMGGPVGQMGQMRVNSPAGLTPYQMSQMNQTMNHPSQHMTQNMGTYNGMNGMGGQGMGTNSNGMNGLGNFKLEPQQPGASAGVSEFSNGSSLTHAQGGSMGNGMNTMGGTPNEHPGPKGGGSMGELNKINGGGASVHETDNGQHGYIHGDGRFIDGSALPAGGQIAEREAALAAAVAAQLQMSTQMANDNGVDTAGLGLGDVIADQEAALAARLNARSPAPNDDGRSVPSGEGFQLPAAAAAAGLAAAQAAAQGRNGRQASDGSCADARRKQRAGSGDSSDARAGGGGGGGGNSGSGVNSGDGGDSNHNSGGQQQQSRVLDPAGLDHEVPPLATPIAVKPHLVHHGVDAGDGDALLVNFLATPIDPMGGPDDGIDGWRQPAEDWAAALVTDGKEAGGTLGKNGRTASMNRVASLEHLAKRMQGCDA